LDLALMRVMTMHRHWTLARRRKRIRASIAAYSQVAAAAPEPGSLALVATALGGLIGLVWRRRRQS
jgi:PEP-CTERM motif